MIEGYKMWMAEGMGAESETSLPTKLFNLKKEFKQEMDTIGAFLDECTFNVIQHPDIVTDPEQFKIKSSEFYRAYKNWMHENGGGGQLSLAVVPVVLHRYYGALF